MKDKKDIISFIEEELLKITKNDIYISNDLVYCNNKNMYSDKDITIEEFNNYYSQPVGNRSTNVLFLVVGDGDFDKCGYVYANNEFDAVYIYQKMMRCYWFNIIAQPIYNSFIHYAYVKKVNSISFETQCKLNNYSYEENPIIEK